MTRSQLSQDFNKKMLASVELELIVRQWRAQVTRESLKLPQLMWMKHLD
jgi:hypothetical protein